MTTASPAFAIETVGLSKRYGPKDAVRDLTLRIPRGGACGFIGLEFGCGLENFIEKWFVSVCVVVGIGGYVTGCAYYLRRLEP